jgi:ribosomal protein S18 acetylase RimI-like enzyme
MPSAAQEARAAAVAFLCAVEDACAGDVVPMPGGHAVCDARHPALWDANHLRVETAPPPDAEALVAAAEHHLGTLPFRAIHVLHADPDTGAALEPPLRAHGYRAVHDLLMLLGEAVPPTGTGGVVEVTPAQIAPTQLAAAQDAGLPADVGRQLASRTAATAAAVPVRWFAVLAGKQTVARCALLGDGSVMQIENVYTAPAQRSHGFARTLVTHAARAACLAGAEVVFLRTAAADWPQRLYRRLGFTDAGVLPRYRKEVVDAGASNQSSSPPSSSVCASSS